MLAQLMCRTVNGCEWIMIIRTHNSSLVALAHLIDRSQQGFTSTRQLWWQELQP